MRPGEDEPAVPEYEEEDGPGGVDDEGLERIDEDDPFDPTDDNYPESNSEYED
jgi:hypothetical protein